MKQMILIFLAIFATTVVAEPTGSGAIEAKNTAASISWTVVGISFVATVSSLIVAFLWHQHRTSDSK